MPALIIAGNWKMNLLSAEATALASGVAKACAELKKCEVWIAPTFTSLAAVAGVLGGGEVLCGAQNVHWEAQGAFTGEVSVPMLKELGATFSLIGHSERRHVFGESAQLCAKRLAGAAAQDLRVIFCVGETLKQREEGATNATLEAQLGPALKTLAPDKFDLVTLAYEPVWAIGTGKVAGPQEIAQAHKHIARYWEEQTKRAAPPILYGGSVSPENFLSIVEVPLVAGVLVGGASLSLEKFTKLIQLAELR